MQSRWTTRRQRALKAWVLPLALEPPAPAGHMWRQATQAPGRQATRQTRPRQASRAQARSRHSGSRSRQLHSRQALAATRSPAACRDQQPPGSSTRTSMPTAAAARRLLTRSTARTTRHPGTAHGPLRRAPLQLLLLLLLPHRRVRCAARRSLTRPLRQATLAGGRTGRVRRAACSNTGRRSSSTTLARSTAAGAAACPRAWPSTPGPASRRAGRCHCLW
jgi:hypothetical protein